MSDKRPSSKQRELPFEVTSCLDVCLDEIVSDVQEMTEMTMNVKEAKESIATFFGHPRSSQHTSLESYEL